MSTSQLAASLRAQAPALSALAITGFVLIGICATSVGLLLDPLMAEFHWKNAVASTLATVYSLATLLSGPLVGIVIDRWGSKLVMIAGTLLAVTGYCALYWCRALPEFYVAFLLIGIGYGSGFFLASTTLIAAHMGEQKNVGMGIWMLAGAIGAALFSLAVSRAITAFGWRMTAALSAVLIGLMVPLMLSLLPSHRRAAPDRTPSEAERRAVPWPLLITRPFLLMSVASAFAAFGMSAIFYHAVPILVKAGFSSHTAGSLLGASWLVSGVGSLGLGVVSNRFGVERILTGSLLFSALGTLALGISGTDVVGIAAVGLFILCWGATANAINQFLPLIMVERFGTAHLGVLVGVQGALMGLVGSFAPIATGSLYDRYATYAAAIVASVIATFIAFALILFLLQRRSPEVQAAP